MKYFKILFILLPLFIISLDSSAQKKQNKREQKSEKQVAPQQKDNAFRPYVPEEQQSAEPSSRRKDKNQSSYRDQYIMSLDQKVDEFHQRMEDNAKSERKLRRKMNHPRYTDFSYFGHKKKPKIRPVGKRKLCKECGIVH